MLVLFLHLFLFVRVLLFCNTKRALDGGGHVFVRLVNHAANVPRMLSVPSKLHFLQTRHRFPNWIKMTKQWRVAALLARMRLLQRTNVMTLVMTKYNLRRSTSLLHYPLPQKTSTLIVLPQRLNEYGVMHLPGAARRRRDGGGRP